MAKPRSPSPLSSGEISSDNEEKAISKNASRIKDSRVNPSDRDAYAKHFKGGNDEYTYRRKHDIYFHFREDDEHPPLSHFRSRTGSRSPSRSPWRPGKLTRKEQQELDERRFGHFFKTPEHVKALKKEALKKEQEKSNMPEKRERTGDHYNRSDNSDPRRFKVHYEDSAPRSRPLQQYGDTGRAPLPKEHMDREASMKESDSFIHPDRQAYHNPQSHSRNHQQHERDRGRRRQRSRSPLRHDNVNSFPGSKDRYRNRHDSESDTEHGYKGSKLQESSSKHAMLKSEDGLDKGSATRSDMAATKSTAEVSSSKAEAEQGQVDEIRPQLSEAEQIEQRRKMREAIRAKHRNNAPLLVQALEQNMPSAPATPIHDSSGRASEQQSPTSAASPGTPHQDSPPGSPAAFVVNDDEELADRRNVDDAANEDDGPSAADYDPNFDMQEDRPDHKRLDMQELAGVNQPLPEQGPASKQKEFDMFAEDDDDDMFAPVDKTVKPSTGGTIQTRTLDASLLDNWDYPDGHYRIILGELLDGRYAVQQQIGKGTFATVIRAQDTRTGQQVAVKIACNNQTMYKAGQKEMDMLRLLNEEDVEDKKHIIRLHRHFDHKGHLCIVFENLSADLREVLKKFGRNVGLNLRAIRSYAQQMFMALSHLKTCKILHADLKPDNILVSEKRSLLKVCDLGTATFARDAEITPYLVSRFYRAPEVILGVEIDYAIDMWSIGCTLFELYTGRILFAGADNNQMLRVIQECRGKIPNRILKRSALVDKHFDIDGNFISQEHDKLTGKATIRQINFNKIAPGKDLRARLSGNIKDMKPEEAKEHAAFVDLMDKCLQLDPARRISPNEALRHKFITHSEKAEKSSVKLAMNVPRKA